VAGLISSLAQRGVCETQDVSCSSERLRLRARRPLLISQSEFSFSHIVFSMPSHRQVLLVRKSERFDLLHEICTSWFEFINGGGASEHMGNSPVILIVELVDAMGF
jgi:hypothetical protein